MTVGDRLRVLRTKLGLSQAELARLAGIERVHITHVETHVNKAGSYHLRAALAKGCGFPLEELSAYIDGEVPLETLLERSNPKTRRQAAAALARDDGVHETAIRSVLDEPLRPNEVERSVLWWAIRMKFREAELLDRSGEGADRTPPRRGKS